VCGKPNIVSDTVLK